MHRAQEPFLSADVQESLRGSGKRGFRQIFRGGRGPHGKFRFAAQSSGQAAVALENRRDDVRGQRSFEDRRASGLSAFGELC